MKIQQPKAVEWWLTAHPWVTSAVFTDLLSLREPD